MKNSAVKYIGKFLLSFLMIAILNTQTLGMNVKENKQGEDTRKEIIKSLNRMNEMLATKDLQKVMSVYDDSDDIMVIGSDSGEVYIGRERVQKFMKMIVNAPFIFSFEMEPSTITIDNDRAWVFIDGKMIHSTPKGKVGKVPYRILAIMVKSHDEWKWKVFSGSIPRGE